MTAIMDEQPFIVGYYVKVKIDNLACFCSTTLFRSEWDAERWRCRYQQRLDLRHVVYVEAVTTEEKR